MSLPVEIGTSMASITVDGASYVWSVWRTTTQGNGVEVWNVVGVMGATTATCFINYAYSASGTVFATAALKAGSITGLGASMVVGNAEIHKAIAVAPWYINFSFGATVTVKLFTVVRSDDGACLA